MIFGNAINRHWFWSYALAVLLYGLTLGLSVLLLYSGIKINLTLPVVFALVATAWYGGLGPGVLISLLFEATTIIYARIPPDTTVPKAIFSYFSVFSLYIFLVVVLNGLRKATVELRIREQQQAAVASFGQLALSNIPLGELLPQATFLSKHVLDVDFTAICEIRADINKLRYTATSGWNDLNGYEFDYDSPKSLARGVLEGDRAILVEDLSKDPCFETSEILRQHGVRSGICVRIAHRSTSYGVFGAFQTKPRKFSDDDAHFLQSIANIIAEASSRIGAETELRNQRTWLDTALTSIGDGVIAADLSGIVTFMNPVAQELTGWRDSSGCGKSIKEVFQLFDEQTRVEITDPVQKLLDTGRSVEISSQSVLRSRTGKEIPIQDTAAPLKDGDTLIGAVVVFSDISKRKQAEAVANRLASIVSSSSDAIISKNLDGIIESWNKGAEQLFGYGPEEVIGKSITILMPPERVNEEPGILGRIQKGESIDHYETVRRRKDGRLIDISLTVSPIRDRSGHIVGASKIARDITKQKLADRAIRQRETMTRIVEAQESERRRIARDLNDHLGQRITAHRLNLEILTKKCPANSTLAGSVDDLQLSASYIDRGISFLSWELRPTELEELGLIDALRNFVREWSAYHGIAAEFHAIIENKQISLRFGHNIETNLYRIVQEALSNILKHAEARAVSVLLQTRDHYLSLIIEDDGRGFDEEDVSRDTPSAVSGLLGMRERAILLNGACEIDSSPGTGTTIHVRIPLKSD